MDNNSLESSPETSRNNEDENVLRFNEELGAVKRQRVEGPLISSPSLTIQASKSVVRTGPFFEDSDDDDELIPPFGTRQLEDVSSPQTLPLVESSKRERREEAVSQPEIVTSQPTLLKYESTSNTEFNQFENIEDFIDDEFPEEGEEYLERKWMEEQGGMEPDLEDALFEDVPFEDVPDAKLQDLKEAITSAQPEPLTPACPICSMSFNGLTDQVRLT